IVQTAVPPADLANRLERHLVHARDLVAESGQQCGVHRLSLLALSGYVFHQELGLLVLDGEDLGIGVIFRLRRRIQPLGRWRVIGPAILLERWTPTFERSPD